MFNQNKNNLLRHQEEHGKLHISKTLKQFFVLQIVSSYFRIISENWAKIAT